MPRKLPALPADLAVLSKTPITVAADLHDLLRKLRDDHHLTKITSNRIDTADRASYTREGSGHKVIHFNRGDAIHIEVAEFAGEMPLLRGIAPDTLGLSIQGPHLDVKLHPLSPPWVGGTGPAWEEDPEIAKDRSIRAHISYCDTLDRMIALAKIVADPKRRLPHDLIEPLRRRLLSAAASCHLRSEEGLGIKSAVAYCAGPDGPMRVIADSPKLGIGFRDLMTDEEREGWQAGFPPVVMFTGTNIRHLAFETPHFGWDEGTPIEAMRAIGGNLP